MSRKGGTVGNVAEFLLALVITFILVVVVPWAIDKWARRKIDRN